jgi:hypothetical protein
VDTGPVAGRLVVSAAALALLQQSSLHVPVQVVVDGLRWLDRSSARVLGFVVRRLEGSHVGFLAAARSEADSLLLHAGLPQHEVPPLDELAAHVRRRVTAAAQGNPSALLELPATMTEGQRLGLRP